MTPPELSVEAFTAAAHQFSPTVGLVLGSGLGALISDEAVVAELSFTQIAGLPPSRVAGHSGRFLLTQMGKRRLLVAQGRIHLYEGHSASEVTLPVRLMASLGVETLILTNAAGSLNRRFAPGRWMMLADHLNLTGRSPLTGGPHFVDMSEAYSQLLRREFADIAARLRLPLHHGVYAGLPGPQYETPAEVRMLRKLGADAVIVRVELIE